MNGRRCLPCRPTRTGPDPVSSQSHCDPATGAASARRESPARRNRARRARREAVRGTQHALAGPADPRARVPRCRWRRRLRYARRVSPARCRDGRRRARRRSRRRRRPMPRSRATRRRHRRGGRLASRRSRVLPPAAARARRQPPRLSSSRRERPRRREAARARPRTRRPLGVDASPPLRSSGASTPSARAIARSSSSHASVMARPGRLQRGAQLLHPHADAVLHGSFRFARARRRPAGTTSRRSTPSRSGPAAPRAARRARSRTACSDLAALGHRAGSSATLDRLALGRDVPAPKRLLRPHSLDRPAVRHREEERPQPAAARVEALGLLPQANEHVLYDLLGQRLVRQDPDCEPVHRGRVLAVDLTERCFVTGNQARRPVSIATAPRTRAAAPSAQPRDRDGRQRTGWRPKPRPGPAEVGMNGFTALIRRLRSDGIAVTGLRATRENGRPCGSRSSGTPAASCRPATARCCAIRGSPRRTSGRGSRFPATTGLDPAAFSAPDYLYVSHLHRDHFDPEWLGRHVHKRARVLLPEFGVGLLERELRSLGFTDFVRTQHGERLDLDGLGVTDPRDDVARRRAARRLGDRARRRHGRGAQPERRPPRQSRRAPRARPVRRAAAAVLGRDLVPDRATTSRAEEKERLARNKRVDEMARARHYVEAVGRRARVPVRGPAVLPRRRALRVQRPRPRPGEHLPRPDRVPRRARRRTASTART